MWKINKAGIHSRMCYCKGEFLCPSKNEKVLFLDACHPTTHSSGRVLALSHGHQESSPTLNRRFSNRKLSKPYLNHEHADMALLTTKTERLMKLAGIVL